MSLTETKVPDRLKIPEGRPTSYRPEFDARARKYALLSLKEYEIAFNFGVDLDTLIRWIHDYPSFAAAIKDGRVNADSDVAESLYNRGTGYDKPAVKIFLPPGSREPVYAHYSEHYPPDTAAAFIWLKNRQPKHWRDKKELDVNMNVEHSMSPEVRALTELMASMTALDATSALQTIEAQAIDVTPNANSDSDSDSNI